MGVEFPKIELFFINKITNVKFSDYTEQRKKRLLLPTYAPFQMKNKLSHHIEYGPTKQHLHYINKMSQNLSKQIQTSQFLTRAKKKQEQEKNKKSRNNWGESKEYDIQPKYVMLIIFLCWLFNFGDFLDPCSIWLKIFPS